MEAGMLVRLISCFLLSGAVAALAVDKPNVVIIYGDDVGYGDVGAYGAKLIPTPNIDKLAAGGLVFTDGHCTAATCTPSRFSLLTGVHAFRYNASILPPNAPLIIPTDIMTLPKLFKKAGYTTAVVGKWHLGLGERGTPNDWNADIKPGPLEIGFDYSFLLPYTNDRVPCVYLDGHRVVNHDPDDPIYIGKKPEGAPSTEYPDGRKNPEAMTFYPNSHGHNHSVINGIGRIGTMCGGKKALWNDETMADEFVNRAKAVIEQNKDKPFFLYFSSQDIHVPRVPHPRFRGKTNLGYRGDAMVQFDWSTGQIMQILDEHGLTENTIVIFSSDNGPVYDDGYQDGTIVKTSKQEVDQNHDGSGPYRGGKYQIYEGGTRVPFIIRWPAQIQPGRSDALVNQVNLLASFADLLGIPLAEDEAIDSTSLLKTFMGKSQDGLAHMIEEANGLALRQGPWKLIPKGKKNKSGTVELYNLDEDISESKNIADEHPERVKAMTELLQQLQDEKGIRTLNANS
jgi:arylsulfatase A-like enzyme